MSTEKNVTVRFYSILFIFLYKQKKVQIRDRNTETNWNKFLVEAVKQFV